MSPSSGDEAAQRDQFDAEVRAAGLTLADDDRERLFATWADHLSTRESLRSAAPALEEEPSFIEKPSQPGAGVTGFGTSGGGA